MGIELKSLKDKYNAEFVFRSEGENIENIGELSIEKQEIKQMVVVLMQSIDAADISKTKLIEIYSESKKLVFVIKENSIIGMLVPANTYNIDIEEEKKEKKIKIKEKPKKIVIKSKEEKVEEKKEEKAAPSASNYILNENTVKSILDIAYEYLEEFAEDIIMNLIKETKTDKNNPTNENIDNLIKKLKKSASLIIGPTHADEMIKKINNKITE